MHNGRTWWALKLVPFLLIAWGVRQVMLPDAPELSLPVPVISAGPQPSVVDAVEPAEPVTAPALRLDRSQPARILIPSIKLRAAVDPIGLASDGTLTTPPFDTAHRASWYRDGPSPGENGTAVITGHVDSKTAVAVFFYLTKLRPGDRISIERKDRRTAVFTVDSLEQVSKKDFPTGRVYGATGRPELRLITCAGKFDAKRHSYADNLIVFGHLTEVI